MTMREARWHHEKPLLALDHGEKATPLRVTVGNVPVDRISMEDAVRWIMGRIGDGGRILPLKIMAANAQLVVLASTNPLLSQAMCSAHVNVPDGVSVVMASRILGRSILERVPGGELMERLCATAALEGYSVFFLGGLPGAAMGTAQQLKRRYPRLRIAGCCCPDYGFESDPVKSEAVLRQIAEAAPDILCVALGAPKQGIWMHEHCDMLPIGAAIAVGAALDTTAGLRRRAPKWTHRIGLEWLYRLVREPQRLWRRYLFGNARFILLVARQWIQYTTTGNRTAD